MSLLVRHLLEHLHRLAPPELAEAWDNVGLIVGDGNGKVKNVLVCLDVTLGTIDEAIGKDCQAIVSHHPPIFKALSRIDLAEPIGKILRLALVRGITLIACHTNLDSAQGGVSDALAQALGLSETQPLQAISGHVKTGLGRIGSFSQPVPAKEFLRRAAVATANPALSVAGKLPEAITTAAVCGGSGSEFAPLACRLGAEVYLSGEIKHNTAVWARESGFCLIDGGHYGTERLAVDLLASWLRGLSGLVIHRTETEQPPFNLVGCPASNPTSQGGECE
ncbi:MAG TPA: Nif3-like dinuclear metal center hexameric protein [Desulfobulbaceae bacterium]|nr:Nif3-like dinuclear metal center hexameric protein [Desulfobulbaceae bacterium]